MRKIFGLGCMLLCLAACKKEIPVYGDRTVKPTLSVISIADDLGNDYSNQIAQATTKDTVLNSGQIAKLTDFPLFKFRRIASNVTIHVSSNSRWTATPPFDSSIAGKWFMNEKTNLIGEGKVVHVIPERNAQSNRRTQQVFYTTQDSSLIVRFLITQMGRIEDPN